MLYLPESLRVTPVVLQDLSLGEQNGGPITQRELVSDLLQHTGAHRSGGLGGILPRDTEEADGRTH